MGILKGRGMDRHGEQGGPHHCLCIMVLSHLWVVLDPCPLLSCIGIMCHQHALLQCHLSLFGCQGAVGDVGDEWWGGVSSPGPVTTCI